MNYSRFIKNTPLVLSLGIAAGFSSGAQALDFNISGHVARNVIAADNGERSGTGFVENAGSPSRIRVVGERQMENGMSAGLRYELSFRRNMSNTWDIDHGNANEGVSTDVRWAEAYVETRYGGVSLGRGDGAANGSTEADFSGNAFIGGGVNSGNNVHGITLVDGEGNPIAKVRNVYGYYDALSRVNRLRYDSPSFGPFSFAASADENDAYEAALSWSSTAPGGKFAAKTGYADSGATGAEYYTSPGINPDYTDEKDSFETYGASAAYLHESGFNLALSYSAREYDTRQNTSNRFIGVGYRKGAHRLSVNMGRTDDLLNKGSQADAYGIAYAFAWNESVELYASYHLLEARDMRNLTTGGTTDAEDVNAIVMGTRIKFL